MQDEANQESEQNEVDGMKKGADSTGKVKNYCKRETLSYNVAFGHETAWIVMSDFCTISLH